MLNSVSKNGAILCGFAIVTTAAIVLTYQGTKEKIAQQRLSLLQATLQQVMPKHYHDNDLTQTCALVQHEDLAKSGMQRIYRAELGGKPTGFVLETTAPNGYSGNIHMLVGVTLEGTVTGVRVLDHKETPGLGDKIDLRISDWILSFAGKQVSDETVSQWGVKKDGGQFDQFTGATITPRAVVNQVEKAALSALGNSQEWLNLPVDCADTEGVSDE
ncbi:electron transport complex subunit RsxG [Alteromonas facilis]|uniref:electron transport complex subunit RsxG n=1 Tax=Alteromonas facilis TaxID=2048004 RepID=UPI000C28FED4|nr:electron transport complex subunit RsxG [Alteromonas facilis]